MFIAKNVIGNILYTFLNLVMHELELSTKNTNVCICSLSDQPQKVKVTRKCHSNYNSNKQLPQLE